MNIRLLNTTTGKFHVFDDPREVHYAILSHVWARPPDLRDPELTYQDVLRIHDSHTFEQNPSSPHQVISYLPQFPEKYRKLCDIAREHGYDYAWADACCIDKTSSSELSQAINAMYDWYRYADVCYVFLHDVPTPAPASKDLEIHGRSRFRTSLWFKRGWTLQELLAPDVVVFLSDVWQVIGTKHTLAPLIEDITTIPRDVLTGRKALEDVSVACRMSWASSRKTTHEEDQAYSLLGIFGVTLRTTYGEGSYAFIRLQQEILKQIPDQTIFAWGLALSTETSHFRRDIPTESRAASNPTASLETSLRDQYLLASSPEAFKDSSHIVSVPWDVFLRRFGEPLSHRPTYTTTPYGIRAYLPLLSTRIENAQTAVPTCVVPLACRDVRSNDYMALLLRSQPQRESDFHVGAVVGNLRDILGLTSNGVNQNLAGAATVAHHYYRLAPFPDQLITTDLQRFKWMDIHIPHWPSFAAYNLERDHRIHSSLSSAAQGDRFQLSVSKWSYHVLKLDGYSITENSTNGDVCTVDISGAPASFGIIRIDVRRCECTFGTKEDFLSANVVLDTPGRTMARDLRERHEMNHFTHIHSWSIRNGTASREFSLALDGRCLTVRLTLTRRAGVSGAYILGVEICKPDSTESRDRGRPSDSTMSRARERDSFVAQEISKTNPDQHLRSDPPSTSPFGRPPLGSRSSSTSNLVGFNISTLAETISSAVERAVQAALFRGGAAANPTPNGGANDASPPQTLHRETQTESKFLIAPPMLNAQPSSSPSQPDTLANGSSNAPAAHNERLTPAGNWTPGASPDATPAKHGALQLSVGDLHPHDDRSPPRGSLWCGLRRRLSKHPSK
ncbi:Vegetative incompatibility protein HET-E-1 [Trametes pubescens]|uniref:Vegetative incompatibility protein HET-E-1 n=1 Tax=Trametes pubescens TaxID=154538 RepID=A0A1M2VIL3_TRAPU|nr:Vegetative incompatibility protein HET-E-1 [Trametes pubescens]